MKFVLSLSLSLLVVAICEGAQKASNSHNSNGDHSTPQRTLASHSQSAFHGLHPEKQQEVLKKLEGMGNYDPDRTRLAKEGDFYIVDDSVPVIPSRKKRMVSGTPPLGYSAQGIPIHHSFPNAPNTIFLNFLGGIVTNTAWNSNFGFPFFNCTPYDTDGNPSVFSTSEQAAIDHIWARVAEDYSPWNVDVTTETPPTMTPRTGQVMITNSVDANGHPLPLNYAGGLSFVGVFGGGSYVSTYQPAFVYYNNLGGGEEDFVGEACAHEMGHNLGLTHDGVINVSPYYYGAGSGPTSWAPIMGAAYFMSVTKFNNGDYPQANNQEDDLAIITSFLGLRPDDVGDFPNSSLPLNVTGPSIYTNGILEYYTDIDAFFFTPGPGVVALTVRPFHSDEDTPGNNVDLGLALLDENETVIVSSAPTGICSASISASIVDNSTYYVLVWGTGDSAVPYSAYGSMGQYVIQGTVTAFSTTTTKKKPHTTTETSAGSSSVITAQGVVKSSVASVATTRSSLPTTFTTITTTASTSTPTTLPSTTPSTVKSSSSTTTFTSTTSLSLTARKKTTTTTTTTVTTTTSRTKKTKKASTSTTTTTTTTTISTTTKRKGTKTSRGGAP